MHRHYSIYRGPFPRRPGLPPMRGKRRGGLLGGLLIGGLGYMLGRQVAQNEYQQSPRPQAGPSSDQLAQLKLLGELREAGVLTEEEFQSQKQKILQTS